MTHGERCTGIGNAYVTIQCFAAGDLCDRLTFEGSSVGLKVGLTGGLIEGFGDFLEEGFSDSFADAKGWGPEGLTLRIPEECLFS